MAAVSLSIALAGAPAFAQTEAAAGAEAGADAAAVEAAAAPEQALLSGEEIDALTSRIALYPDPLLELTLQGATFPLQAVQAVRFLEKHAKDPALKPDQAWDESILGLLNYPVVLDAMNADLDWTEALGNAVLTQLDDVQQSIQQFRSQLYAGGVLKTDEKQRVIVSNEVIAILPADAEIIYVPQTDAADFAGSEETETAADTSAEAALEPSAGTDATQAAEEQVVEEPQAAAAAPAATEQVATTAAAPAPVVYSEPYPSYWSTAATFLGGAAIGGLIGYAIGDDDDDDCCDFDDDDWDGDGGGNNWSKKVNIEDSNIIINRDDDVLDGNRDRVRPRNAQSELRKRQGRGQTAAVNQRDLQSKGTAPARKARAAQPTQQPAALKQPAQQKSVQRQRPGDTQAKRAETGALSGAKGTSGKQVKAESRRGSESRAVAKNKAPSQQMQTKKWPQTGGGVSKPRTNKQVTRQSNRGKASGGGKRRRG
jgi:hypothetical protein